MPARPGTGRAASLGPLPSWPAWLAPKHHIDPPAWIPHTWSPEVLTADHAPESTRTGACCSSYEPVPRTPPPPEPQHQRPFKSIDVQHRFYAPALGLGPIVVEPGHVEEVLVTPKVAGVFDYYCTLFCGAPHFAMRGEIVVTRNENSDVPPPPARMPTSTR